MKIHPRENDLIIGTHGRSLWVMDDISPLQQMDDIATDASIHLFDQKKATLWHNISRGGQRGHFWFAGENPPTIENTSSIPRAAFNNLVAISFYIDDPTMDSIDLRITNALGDQSLNTRIDVGQGVNRYYWDRLFDSQPFSSEEEKEIEQIFGEIMDYNSSSSIRRYYRRWLRATSPEEQQ